jgi:hypothetical protein
MASPSSETFAPSGLLRIWRVEGSGAEQADAALRRELDLLLLEAQRADLLGAQPLRLLLPDGRLPLARGGDPDRAAQHPQLAGASLASTEKSVP